MSLEPQPSCDACPLRTTTHQKILQSPSRRSLRRHNAESPLTSAPSPRLSLSASPVILRYRLPLVMSRGIRGPAFTSVFEFTPIPHPALWHAYHPRLLALYPQSPLLSLAQPAECSRWARCSTPLLAHRPARGHSRALHRPREPASAQCCAVQIPLRRMQRLPTPSWAPPPLPQAPGRGADALAAQPARLVVRMHEHYQQGGREEEGRGEGRMLGLAHACRWWRMQ